MPPDGPPPRRGAGFGAGDGPPLCGYCNDVMGVYEPIVLLMDGERPQLISRAAAPLARDAIVLHQDCFRQSRVEADAEHPDR